MGHVTMVGGSGAEVERFASGIRSGEAADLPSMAVVGVIMGSDSDLPQMKSAAEVLKEFGVPFEIDFVSAHRTPDKMIEYARQAQDRGIKVIIAGAGGAAHLPGMVAATTCLPVIGVPVPIGPLGGTDALHSIVQMPKGVPVATVAIGNAANAALLAIRILATADIHLSAKLQTYQRRMETEVAEKSGRLKELGWEHYVRP